MSTLKSLVDETTNIKDDIVSCRNNLENNLKSKGVEVIPGTKMSILIDKVTSLEPPLPKEVFIYKNGNEFNNLTGGWNNILLSTESTFTKNPTFMNVKAKRSGGGYGGLVGIQTEYKLDLSQFKSISVKININTCGSGGKFKLVVNTSKGNDLNTIAFNEVSVVELKEYVINLDISNINDLSYVTLRVFNDYWGEYNDLDLNIHEIFFER